MGVTNEMGHHFRRLREADGMTTEDLAEHLGIAVSDLKGIEAGRMASTTTQLDAVVDLFCISMDDIMEGRTQTMGLTREHQVGATVRSDINRILRNLEELHGLDTTSDEIHLPLGKPRGLSGGCFGARKYRQGHEGGLMS